MKQEGINRDPCKGSCPSRPSFREAFRRAADQTELHCAPDERRDAYRELCYLIAEVYILREESRIKIGGELLDAYLVQEIFGELRAHHLAKVWSSFRSLPYEVKNKRAYLRTALYNAIFETEAEYLNVAAVALFGEGEG